MPPLIDIASLAEENVYEPSLVLIPVMIADSEKDASTPTVFVTWDIA
jgi:hypothetical protein